MRRRQLVLLSVLVCVVVCYFGCGLALRYSISVPAILYWFFFLAIPSVSVLLMSDNETCNLIVLLLNSISVYSMFFLQNTTWFPASRDTQFEMQVVSMIRDKGVWIPGMGTGFSTGASFNPGLHIFLASFSAISGLQPYQVMFFVPWLKGVAFTLFFYLLARDILPNAKAAFLASIIYLGTIWYLSFPHRELFAEIFFIGALWIYFKKEVRLSTKIVLVFFVISMTVSHHFTSYVFLLTVIVIYFFVPKGRRKTINPLLPATVILSWVVFVSINVSSQYTLSFLNALQTVLTLRFPAGPNFAATSYYYTPFENVILFLNPILVCLIAFPSFFSAAKSGKKKMLVAITLVFGGLLALAIPFYIFKTPGMGTALLRIMGFVYIPLSIWACLFLWKRFGNLKIRTIASMALIIIIFASMNLSSVESGIKKWYVPRGYIEAYVYSDSMINTATWCNEHLSGSIMGDHFAYDVVGTWGYKEITGDFFYWYQTKNDQYLKTFDYVIFSPWDEVTYLDTIRQPIDPLRFLPQDLDIVYASGDFLVYNNPHR